MYDAKLVTSDVCLKCGACCSVEIDGELVACPSLIVADGLHTCGRYDTRPEVCKAYNCISDANRKGLRLDSETSLVGRRAIAAILIVHGHEPDNEGGSE